MDSIYVKIVVVLVALALLKPVLKILLFVVVRTFFRGWLNKVGAMAMAEQPDEIHLAPAPEGIWADREAVEELATPLKQLGFEEAGVFSIREMEGVCVRLMAQPAQSIAACVYEHPQAGHWIDLVCEYSDERSVTYTTSRATGLDPRPGTQTVNAPGTDPEALYQRLLRERPNGDLKEITPTSVATLFTDAYAKSTQWRKNKGVSADEVARQMQLTTSGS
jgi:hypothetical protein